MTRYAVLLVMLMSMLWQSMALARVGSTVNALADTEHAALHWQGEDHHHHPDGSYHLDDSSESAQHVFSDHLSAVTALLPTSAPGFAALGASAPADLHETRAPSPILDGLLRPPRSRA
jgi:hypothetical protein